MKFRQLSSIFGLYACFVSIERATAFPTSISPKKPSVVAFSSSSCSSSKHNRHFVLHASSSSSGENNKERNTNNSSKSNGSSRKEDDSDNASPFLSLPPIGESSYGSHTSTTTSSIDEKTGHKQIILNSDKGTEVAQVGSSKFELQYTCNLCETRNSHQVSRLAYTKGVVITVCKGCMAKHLIADNLGWSKHWGLGGGFEGKTNIEEYMDDIGKGDEVNRVSKDVFQLEQLYCDNDNKDNGEQLSESDGSAFE